MIEPDVVLAICRFLHDSTAMALWGALAFLWALVPAGLADSVGRGLAPHRTFAIAVVLITTIAALPLEAAAIGNGWPDALDPATARAILFETSVGTALMAQAVAALILAAARGLPARMRLGATAAASGLLLATLALTGHASMHRGALGAVHRLNDVAHLLAGGAWLGALVPLLPLLRALDDGRDGPDAGVALRRFSAAGHGAVVIVIATGIGNTMLVLGRWPTQWSSPYQALLAAKVALVVVMTALALVNRYILVPRMPRSRAATIGALRRATMAEIALSLVVVALVSTFGLLEPA